jgi:hypothetical protein
MDANDEYLTILRNAGWHFYEKCRCGGVLKWKYRHPDKPGLELEWWLKYYQFQITERNKVKVPPTRIENLKTQLEQL